MTWLKRFCMLQMWQSLQLLVKDFYYGNGINMEHNKLEGSKSDETIEKMYYLERYFSAVCGSGAKKIWVERKVDQSLIELRILYSQVD